MIHDILYASIFTLFYNLILANSISILIEKSFSINRKNFKKLYFSTIGLGTIFIIGYAFVKFNRRIEVLDRKYYPVSRFIKFKALGLDYTKI